MQDVDFSGNAMVSQIAERLKTSARVEVVYGEERKIGDKTIIPIAVVAYAFGGGSGGGAVAAGFAGTHRLIVLCTLSRVRSAPRPSRQ